MSNAIRQFEVDDALSGLGANQTRLLDSVAADGPVVPQSKLWVGVADSMVQRGILLHDCNVTPWVYRLTTLGMICANERNQIHSCMACGRAEDSCSQDPCDAVLADRGEQLDPPPSPICKDCGTDHSDGRDRERCKQAWLAKQDSPLTLQPGEFYQHPYPTPSDTNMDRGTLRGYDLVACDGMDHPAWEIQRVDDVERFDSDGDAQWQAIQDAVNGDEYAQLILWAVMRQVGPEVNLGSPSWLRSAWETKAWQVEQIRTVDPTWGLGPGDEGWVPPLREMTALDLYPMVSCIVCGSADVEISYPAWHDPNAKLAVVESDLEADPLSCHCKHCDDSGDATLLSWEFGEPQTICGRW